MAIEHWTTAYLSGSNASFQRAAREYAEEYADMAVAEERERCANYCDGERLYNTARALRNGKFARPTADGKPDTSEPVVT